MFKNNFNDYAKTIVDSSGNTFKNTDDEFQIDDAHIIGNLAVITSIYPAKRGAFGLHEAVVGQQSRGRLQPSFLSFLRSRPADGQR